MWRLLQEVGSALLDLSIWSLVVAKINPCADVYATLQETPALAMRQLDILLNMVPGYISQVDRKVG